MLFISRGSLASLQGWIKYQSVSIATSCTILTIYLHEFFIDVANKYTIQIWSESLTRLYITAYRALILMTT